MQITETGNMNWSPLKWTRQYCIVAIIAMAAVQGRATTTSVEINSNWRFRKTGDELWMNATVPGTVHTDLIQNQKIPDPFFGDNEQRLQWIDTCEWEYETWFDISDSDTMSKHCELIFEGLDTYADVFLNDQLMLAADNMFRTWKVDCKKNIVAKRNHLLIRFQSASKKGKAESKKLPYNLPGDEKVFARKAQYHYGWDWGPRFATCGIWRPVKIEFMSSFRLNDVHLVVEQLTDSVATIVAGIDLTVEKPTTFNFEVIAENQSKDSFSFERMVFPEEKVTNFIFDIKNPVRWWPAGLGDASLYNVTIRVTDQSGETQERIVKTGLRTVQLITEEDQAGERFYFKVNGVPVFMKGSNWIPADNFLPRVTREKYLQLLLSAKNANMNMLRVWGGGIYEDDTFYELCDSLGILVWQDFMFACAMYPGDSGFFENVRGELTDNVIRLRNHPCIAMWCGNNEVDEGWKNWGWQKQYGYTEKDSAEIWQNYLKLFHELIPQQVALLDPIRNYWPSSPSIGWGHKQSLLQGDSHYWGVWWGMESFETYIRKTGRFMSEYGFQGMPSMGTINSFTDPGDRNFTSEAIKNHQKHPTGYKTIDHYMNDWYKKPKDFDSYAYVSQLLQADGMLMAIESHRRAKPYCMGTLYWQFNDCWPVTSWSSIDHSGSWKALHYAVREAYKKHNISVVDTGQLFTVHITSDDTVTEKATLRITAEDFSGNVLWKDSAFALMSPERSILVYRSDLRELTYTLNPYHALIKLRLVRNGETISTKNYYFKKPKELLLAKPEISFSLRKEGGEMLISLSTNTLAKDLFLDMKDGGAFFSDNFFDLSPHDTKTVTVQSALTVEEFRETLMVRSLFDTY